MPSEKTEVTSAEGLETKTTDWEAKPTMEAKPKTVRRKAATPPSSTP